MQTATDSFLPEPVDPVQVFRDWLAEAKASEVNDPNAMSLATVTAGGVPSVRIVLMKRLDERGFAFYTNRDSQKGHELLANPNVALCFHWKTLQRQVRVMGEVSEVSTEDADDYFHSRYRISQIGAWASQQSRPLDSRETLERRSQDYDAQFPDTIPRPPYWTGFIVAPASIEFWQERPFRLHDRVVFTRAGEGWERQLLYP